MNNERINLIIRNIELLLNQLKLEVQDTMSLDMSEVQKVLSEDYDQIFNED